MFSVLFFQLNALFVTIAIKNIFCFFLFYACVFVKTYKHFFFLGSVSKPIFEYGILVGCVRGQFYHDDCRQGGISEKSSFMGITFCSNFTAKRSCWTTVCGGWEINWTLKWKILIQISDLIFFSRMYSLNSLLRLTIEEENFVKIFRHEVVLDGQVLIFTVSSSSHA